MYYFIFGFIFSILVGFAQSEEAIPPVIETTNGNVHGTVTYLRDDVTTPVYTYRGIPYAAPPVGKLRFAPPEPVEKWRREYDATSQGPMCPQPLSLAKKMFHFQMIYGDYDMSEDCLRLSIHTPEPDGAASLPVFVFIHGGGFIGGYHDFYDGSAYAALHNTVFVTINYRLGILGFLSSSDGVIPGNLGIRDQQLALQWIQENIPSFGGDASRVTIFGSSAGAVSVYDHVISPASEGLFQRAIIVSGPHIIQPTLRDEEDKSLQIAKELGCPTSSSQEILDCLRSRSAEELVTASLKIPSEPGSMPWGPVMDGDVIPYTANELDGYNTKKFDLMMTYASHEGFMYTGGLTDITSTEACMEYVVKFIKTQLRIADQFNLANLEGRLMKYCDGSLSTSTDLHHEGATLAVGDYFVVLPGLNILHHHIAKKQSAYLLEFRYNSEFLNRTVQWATSHGDLTYYMFGDPMMVTPVGEHAGFNEEQTQLSRDVLQFFANFVKTGNPNSESSNLPLWPSYKADNQQYLVLAPDITIATLPVHGNLQDFRLLLKELGSAHNLRDEL